MGLYEYKCKVSLIDVTKNNELSQKGLMRILTDAAAEHSEVVGYGLNEIDETKLSWMVLQWKIKMYEPPKWDTELTIKTWACGFDKLYAYRDFEVYAENKLIAIATSKWVLINTEKFSVLRIPEKVVNDYNSIDKKVFEDKIPDNKNLVQEGENLNYEYVITRRDIDVNNHVNNLYYLDFAYNAMPKELSEYEPKEIEITYKKQTKIGEKIKCYYSYQDGVHIVVIKNEDGQVIHAIVKMN